MSILAQAKTATTPPSNTASPSSSMSVAKIDDFIISCENLSRNLETGESELSGHVQIIYKDQHISADFVKIDQVHKKATLDGNVTVNNATVEIGGDHIELDYEKNTSAITNGYVKSNNIFFSGKFIQRQGQDQFYVEDANYTACSNCPATWSFDGNEIDAKIGGYALIKNTFLRLSGIPVLWLPYLLVPLKNERQTGLLSPVFGYINNRKTVISESLFLALSRSQDMTFTLTNYQVGGLKKQIEYRYALNDLSSGMFNVSHIADSLFASDPRYTRFTAPDDIQGHYDRWSLRGYNEYAFSPREKLRLSINQISDLGYPKDFYDEFPNYADSGLENRLNYTNNSDNTSFSVGAIYYKHLLEANALSNNSAAVHQLPEIKYDSTVQQISQLPIYYKFNLNYTNFYRESNYDDVSLSSAQRYVTNGTHDPRCENNYDGKLSTACLPVYDGKYDELNDLIRTGQRMMVKGTLLAPSYPAGDIINISPEVSYNESHYIFPLGESKYSTKRYLEFDIMSRSKLYRVFETADNKYKHEFIPELSYRWIPWMQENGNPFFGLTSDGETPIVSKHIISDNDLSSDNKVQFDYNDRIYDRNLITLTLLNRVIRKTNDTQMYYNVFDFQLKQSYDLYQALYGKDKNQPLSALYGNMNFYHNEFTFSNESYYYPYQSATNSTSTLTYMNEKQQYVKLGFISKRTDGPKQDDVSVSLGFVTSYLNLLTGIILDTSEYRQSDSRVKKVSMIAQIKPPGDCWAINLYREQKIGAEAEYKVSFDFSWDGKPTRVIPPVELNIN